MKKLIAATFTAIGLLGAASVQASEPMTLIPVHQEVVSTGAFALNQPAIRCYNGCSFHYFAPGDSYTADYVVISPLDGYRYYVVTVDGQTGYVLVPPVIGFGA